MYKKEVIDMKKAQSALEFLMTYGWAFLVILIMIGALAYFGVLNPQKFLPDRCNFGTQINCDTDYVAVKKSATPSPPLLIARLVNGVGKDIGIYGLTVTTPTVPTLSCSACLADPANTACPVGGINLVGAAHPGVKWENGRPKNLIVHSCTGGDALSVGSKVRLEVTGSWVVSGADAAFAKALAGEIYASVQ